MTTAARPPQLDISLDTLPALTSLRDFQRADASIVRVIEAQQHALMCGWGTPPQCFTANSWHADTTTATFRFLLRVPPFCTRFRVAVCGYGAIAYTFAVGALTPTSVTVFAEPNPGLAQWFEGSASTSLGNQDGFMQVLAAQSASWQTVTVTLTRDLNYAGWDFVFALAFYPLLEQAV